VLDQFSSAMAHLMARLWTPLMQPNSFGATPPQLRHFVEEYELKRTVLRSDAVSMMDSTNMVACDRRWLP